MAEESSATEEACGTEASLATLINIFGSTEAFRDRMQIKVLSDEGVHANR